jgi:hypothetical protein
MLRPDATAANSENIIPADRCLSVMKTWHVIRTPTQTISSASLIRTSNQHFLDLSSHNARYPSKIDDEPPWVRFSRQEGKPLAQIGPEGPQPCRP